MKDDLLREELEFFRANNRFADEYPNRYLVIKGTELVGDFEHREDALREVYRRRFDSALVRKAGERSIPLLAVDVPGRCAPLLTPLDPDTLEPLSGEALENYYLEQHYFNHRPEVSAPASGFHEVSDGVHVWEEDDCSCCGERRVGVRLETRFSLMNQTSSICIKCLSKAYRKALNFKSKLRAAP